MEIKATFHHPDDDNQTAEEFFATLGKKRPERIDITSVPVGSCLPQEEEVEPALKLPPDSTPKRR